MKLLLVSIIPAVLLFACTSNKKVSGNKIKAKLVHTSCASAVVQIMDSSKYSLGQDAWQQSADKPVYRHVFAVQNQCSFKKNNIAVGDEFYFTLYNTDDTDCVVCMLWDNPPAVKHIIQVVK